MKDYPKLIKNKEKQPSIANIAHGGDENLDSDIALTCSYTTNHKDELILDLDCMYHICPN